MLDPTERLELLRRFQATLTAVDDAQAAAVAAVQHLRALAPDHRVSVMRFDPIRGRAVIVAESAPDGEEASGAAEDLRQTVPSGQLGPGGGMPMRLMHTLRSLEAGRVVRVDDLQAGADGPLAQALLKRGIHAYAAVPLRAAGSLVGSLNIGSPEPCPVDAGLVDVAQDVAPLLALGLRDFALIEREHEAELRYRSFFEGTPVGLYRMRRDGHLEAANPALVSLLGYDHAGQLLGRSFVQLWVERAEVEELLGRLERVGTVRGFEGRVWRRDGSVVWVQHNARAVRTAEGELEYYEGSLEDVTERRWASDQLRVREQRFRALVQHSSDVILVVDRHARITYATPAVEQILGYRPDDILGESLFRFLHREDRRAGVRDLRRLAQSGGTQATTEVRVRHANGTYRYFDARATNLLDDPTVEGVVLNARDITARRLAEERLVHDALHDALTGLPNRAFFMERLEHALEFSRRRPDYYFAVLYLDFDRFKVINDSLGHAVGDQLLVAAGRRLATCLRQVDTLARLGGDEFGILLDGIRDLADATRIAERIHYALAAPMLLDGHEVVSTASIGIASGHAAYPSPTDMLRDADIAMYQAKEAGPGRHVVFDGHMHDRAVAQLRLESDLRRAVERNEFSVSYQPIMALATGRMAGFEALVRWRHPERGLLLPEEFVPAAEETGLIIVLGRWILDEATRQAAAWQREFPEEAVSVSVNLSSKQFHHPDLVGDVEAALHRSGLAPDRLHLEITEQVIVVDPARATDTFVRLKDLGVHLDIDDFGTGYSSLSMLSHFPVDVLKTDRSFVSRMNIDESDREIVRAVFSLARSLGLRVVAEGVETPEQLARLRSMGCQFAQGFFFAQPLEAEEARRLLGRSAAESA